MAPSAVTQACRFWESPPCHSADPAGSAELLGGRGAAVLCSWRSRWNTEVGGGVAQSQLCSLKVRCPGVLRPWGASVTTSRK